MVTSNQGSESQTLRPLAYIMSPIKLHGLPKYQQCYERAKIVFNDYAVLPGQFADTASWLEIWPQILPLIDIGILLRYKNEPLTRGVEKEVRDLTEIGCDIYTFSLGRFDRKAVVSSTGEVIYAVE